MSSICERAIGQIARFVVLSGIDHLLRQNGPGPIHDQTASVLINKSWTFRPHGADYCQPSLKFLAKLSGTRILDTPELADEAELSE
jgi:hypothetical protein